MNYIHFEHYLLGNRNKSTSSFSISFSSLQFLVWCNDGKFQPKEAHIHKRAILFSRKAKLILWRIWMKWVAEMHWTKKQQQTTFQICWSFHWLGIVNVLSFMRNCGRLHLWYANSCKECCLQTLISFVICTLQLQDV